MCVCICVCMYVCVCFIWDSLAPWWDFRRFCLTKPYTHCQIHEQSIKINFWTAKYKWLACQQCRWSPTAPPSVIHFPCSHLRHMTPRNITGSEFLPNSKLQPFTFGLFLSVYLITVLGNLLISLAVSSDPHLHTPMHFFLFNLSFADICFTSTIILKMLKRVPPVHLTSCVSHHFTLQA